MATYTSNINLKKPAQSDKIRIADFNGNADNIDAAIGADFGQGTKPSINQAINSLADGLAIIANGNVHAAITAGQFVYVRNHDTLSEGLYVASSNISANGTLSGSNLTADGSGGLNALNSNITNNYTDYNSNGNYHIRVSQLGKMVIVSGEVFGTGTAGYITDIALPTPFGYDGGSELMANAVIFYARNQTTGAIQQMRTGADHYIYREAAMTNGQAYSFAFSYCK